MADKVRYLSPAWRDEVEKRFKQELTPEKMKNLTTSVAFIYTNCPDGKTRCLYFRSVDGIITEVASDEDLSREAEFVITADYDLFARVTQGTLSSQRALMSGKLKLKGNMVKALKLASLSDRMNKIMFRIPTEY
ncbi:MAG TPA: SCP2 sterol-binding domain-containing protein [Deltaproteobacteria bacterium]|jgi:putative sterol carrier protein|nr:SCP2 sterol-binding domain-containing protein [Deltaproteobacteria bacterium]HOI07113.1 SCP2 sterol-binding domain-containing protein [Deltaproteobacteria bacterium]